MVGVALGVVVFVMLAMRFGLQMLKISKISVMRKGGTSFGSWEVEGLALVGSWLLRLADRKRWTYSTL